MATQPKKSTPTQRSVKKDPALRSAVNKKPSTTKSKRTPSKTKKINLPIGGGNHLVITIKKTSAKKPSTSRSTRKKPTLQTRLKKLITPNAIIPLALVTFGLIGSAYFGTQVVRSATIPAPQSNTTISSTPAQVPDPIAYTLPASQPTELRIDDIDLTTSLITLGLNDDKTIAVPKEYDVAGWYKYGPTPGELGPAVILGHVDSFAGPAVFWRLRELETGQRISVTRQDGTTATFKVDSLKNVSRNSFPTDEVYGPTDHAALRLITCGGTFNVFTGEYSDNTIAFATLVK